MIFSANAVFRQLFPLYSAGVLSPWAAVLSSTAQTFLRLSIIIFTVLFCPHSRADTVVPIDWCKADGANCTHQGPPYEGPTPANWEEAAQLACERFAAAHYPTASCPCDGTVCSIAVSCELVTTVLPSMVGANRTTGRWSGVMTDTRNGNIWYATEKGGPTCRCPESAGFREDGACVCPADRPYWDGEYCVMVCPAGQVPVEGICQSCGCGQQENNGQCVPMPEVNEKVWQGDTLFIYPYGQDEPCSVIEIPQKDSCQAGKAGKAGNENSSTGPSGDEGNPISCSSGIKHQTEIDYRSAGPDPLIVRRYYQSNNVNQSATGDMHNEYALKLEHHAAQGTITLSWPDGGQRVFVMAEGTGTAYSNKASHGQVEQNGPGWDYVNVSGSRYSFNQQGQLLGIEKPSGDSKTITYYTSGTGAGKIASVTNRFGISLNYVYDAQGRLASVEVPGGETIQYSYDSQNRLIGVAYPGDIEPVSKIYHYENVSLPYALTGITDENQQLFASWSYDSQGRAISSEHAGGVEKVTLEYLSTNQTRVRKYLNADDYLEKTYTFTGDGNNKRVTDIEYLPCATCPAYTESWTYDSNGFVDRHTDANGHSTDFDYTIYGLEVQRIEAVGEAEQRTIATDHHPTLRLPTQISEPGKTIAFTYDSNGNVLTRTETDTTVTPNVARSWTYTYNTYGQVLTVDGPRSDVNDVTTYTYDAQGNRSSMTNALNQTTLYTSYDAHGNLLSMTDPNGVVTTLSYDARQRLLTRTVADGTADASTTGFDYDAVGNLTRITQANGSYLDYTYDDANRLTEMEDNLGNRIEYTLDNAGNRTAQQTYNAADTLVQTQTAVFDELSRLIETIGASSQRTEYAYDDNGNPIQITDPKDAVTTQAFDALNRLIEIQDPLNGATDPTEYGYDDQDNLTQVTDPEGNVTTYTYNGFGEVITQTSPNTGTTTYTYDAAGNRSTQTDARNITVTYTYDALNRLTGIVYPDTDENISYTYDQTTGGNYGIGRLTQIDDHSGSTQYRYDRRGNITTVTTTINIPLPSGEGEGEGIFTTHYAYDLADNLIQITYPDNRTVDYTRNSIGQISAVTTTYNSQPQILANNIGYQPFGPINAFTYGNNLSQSRVYDLDSRPDSVTTTGIQSLDYGYDLNSNVASILDVLDSLKNQSFDYDLLNRLTDGTGIYGDYDFDYDGVGNRLLETLTTEGTGITEVYQYQSQNQRLAQRDTIQYQYDNVGNTTAIGTDAFTYNDANRLETATVGSLTTTYHYNALGQRVLKTNTNQTVLYLYDLSGQLIAEANDQGAAITEYIWLDDQPLAMVQGGNVYYIHNDHLNTPTMLTDQNQSIAWKADYKPFGEVDEVINTVEFNLRRPGQYHDRETGLYQNYFREYDPKTGRYITSDPIGLRGGLNTYLYVDANPTNYFDLYGLQAVAVPGAVPFPVDAGTWPGTPENKRRNEVTQKAIDALMDQMSWPKFPDVEFPDDFPERPKEEDLTCTTEPPRSDSREPKRPQEDCWGATQVILAGCKKLSRGQAMVCNAFAWGFYIQCMSGMF